MTKIAGGRAIGMNIENEIQTDLLLRSTGNVI